MRGIDVSSDNGVFDWDDAAKKIDFAIIKASQGKSDFGKYEGDFAVNSQFARNASECARLGIPYGAYHYLTAQTVQEAHAEAQAYIETLRTYANGMTLWAAVDVESPVWLPRDKELLTEIVYTFTEEVMRAGYNAMIYTNPDFLRYRFNWKQGGGALWLALWNSTEANALSYGPVIWQYGLDPNFTQAVDGDIGYFELPGKEENGESSVKKAVQRVYETWDAFDEGESGQDGGYSILRKGGIFQEHYPDWDSFKADEERLKSANGECRIVVTPIVYTSGIVGDTIDITPYTVVPEDRGIGTSAVRTRVEIDVGGTGVDPILLKHLESLTYTDATDYETDDIHMTFAVENEQTAASILTALTESGKPLGVRIVRERWKDNGTRDTEELRCGSFYTDVVQETFKPSKLIIAGTTLAMDDTVSTTHTRTYGENGDVTLLQIAETIADRFGLVLVDTTNPTENYETVGAYYDPLNTVSRAKSIVYRNLKQTKQTDLGFLADICAEEDISVKVTDGRLCLFEGASTINAPYRYITQSDLTTASFSSASETLRYKKVTVNYTDTDGHSYSGEARDKTVSKGRTLKVQMKVESDAEAKSKAENILRIYNTFSYSAGLEMPGDVAMAAGCYLGLYGFGFWDGVYKVTEAKHMVSSSGYKTSVEVKKVRDYETQ